ncbi:MAG: tetratricopeptide repeat protein [Chthoniobacterales bacterium]
MNDRRLAGRGAIALLLAGLMMFALARPAGAATAAEEMAIRARMEKGIAEVRKREFDQAIYDFSFALRLNPDARHTAELYGNRGGAYAGNDDLERAMADADGAVKVDPEYFGGYQVRGLVHYLKREFEAALAEFKTALRLNPSYSQLYVNRGNVFRALGDQVRARADFDRAITLGPTNFYAFINRGNSYVESGNVEAALADFHRSIVINPHQGEAYCDRAMLYMDQGKFSEALKDWNDYVRLNPTDMRGYAARGFAYSKQGNYRDAVADLQKAIELASANAELLNALAWIRATCPDAAFRSGETAMACARQACELGEWKHSEAVDALAAACAEAGHFDEAVKYQKQALELKPRLENRAGMQKRLALYESGKPYREEPAASPTPGR